MLKIIHVEPYLGVKTAARLGEAEICYQQLAGTVYTGAQQVTAHAGIVQAAAGKVHVQVGGAVLHGKVAREVGNLHLLLESFIHILLGGRIQEAERSLRDGSYAFHHAGLDLLPLGKIASGGELSRLTLALKCLSLGGNAVQILFFDEIDAGISATVAGAIAERLGLLGGDHQVFVITHMPVIAAAADTQYLVEKKIVEGNALVAITPVAGEKRKEELSRMLGGNEREARDYAEKLLKTKGRTSK